MLPVSGQARTRDGFVPADALVQLKFIADNLPVLIAHCDAQARYLFVNRPYSARFGCEPEDLIGQTIDAVVGRAAYEALRPYVERALAGERVIFEIEVPYDELGPRIMRCEYVPTTTDGRTESFIATVLDVTDQRRAENALRDHEAHFRAAFELSAVGQAMIDANRRYVLVNDRYCEMTGYSREELIGKLPEDITHADDIDRDLELRSALRRGDVQSVTLEKRYVHKSGSVIWVRVHATLFRVGSGTPLAAFSMIEDITEHKLAAEQREALFAREHAARLAAEEANRTKDDFLASLSHELRTPLNAILGWTQMLQRKVVAPGRVEAALEALDRNARRQAQLVDDLLDVSRIAAGRLKLNIERVSLSSVLDSSIETVRPALDAKRLVLEVDVPPVDVDADPIRLQQVFWNLLSNAVKFTPDGGGIRVSGAALPEQVSITVRDTGMGIDPAFAPRLFSRFEQADRSPTRTFEGLGLGLAIVRHLVELHGGTVSAESAGRGLGAAFTVALPTPISGRPRVSSRRPSSS